MSSHGRIWFGTFAVVGLLAGAAATLLLWLLVAHPITVVQALSGWP